ncbi:hypothetical protein GCM10010245_42090 [Streptomyces spectabilis]|uniref:Uncharacterized protein n=1 Tax=Streptomyces spectabilis TaxID=68270 RepID=A0A7W8AZL3_STRST|nr:hypothetical protein [Streptomyces spectabilis]GGV25350.1 hypothetical protein GCM10010245_42090 [Streptomyces spectabilis]
MDRAQGNPGTEHRTDRRAARVIVPEQQPVLTPPVAVALGRLIHNASRAREGERRTG